MGFMFFWGYRYSGILESVGRGGREEGIEDRKVGRGRWREREGSRTRRGEAPHTWPSAHGDTGLRSHHTGLWTARIIELKNLPTSEWN
jgi:hypothetical protein